MLIFGHPFIESKKFYHVQEIKAIDRTPSNSTILIDFDESHLDIIQFAIKNGVDFALEVKTILEVIYASSLGAKYILVHDDISIDSQKIATEYLFDAKILVRIDKDEEIEKLAFRSIDGVIFADAIIKTVVQEG
ncbi:MAG: hypothetical protein U9N42_03360 [Campylobacterota bacterium]|nr:hypothetical protein [Campylobacterota bacterium]